jgi:hypothetical protein
MTPPLQVPVHLVEQDVGQQRRERPALRRASIAPLHHAIAHDPSIQVRPDQPQYRGIVHAPLQPVDQYVVIDPVEKLLQVDVHHDAPSGLHVRLGGQHRLLRPSSRAKPIAMLAERRIEPRLQHLQQRLLDQPIGHRRDAKLALASVRLRNRYPSYRTGPVRPL